MATRKDNIKSEGWIIVTIYCNDDDDHIIIDKIVVESKTITFVYTNKE